MIEKSPDLFYNNDKFRQWQAKARFRAVVATLITIPTLATVASRGRDGIGLLRRNWVFAVPGSLAVGIVYFYVFHRMVGYSNQSFME